MAKLGELRKVLILGSGAIKIGEAGEFDYSGAQAIKALREEGIKVILANPNIATIQSDEDFVDRAYFVPLNTDSLEKVINKERPDGIMLSFGGQTALNAGIELHEKGILDRYGVKILGTGIFSIETCDDRKKFRDLMVRSGLPVPRSETANSVEEALKIARQIGYPVIIRVAYTLGGQGSGFARNEADLREIASRGLASSRINQVLVEESLRGWKEIEYEVMRDADDNCAIVCNMENFDPMGVHTGDSIVVAPSQTLNNREYQMLRTASFKAVRALKILGECNIQFALDPRSEEFRVIEVNSRLSRSSALASKATGYPIAYIAAKLAIGFTLPELRNKITQITTACFEPAIDYIVVKVPRWDFKKFRRVERYLGTQMKSVGEVMAIGRRFEEALQKAVRMTEIGRELTDTGDLEDDPEKIRGELANPTDMRLFYIVKALESGISVEEIYGLTGIDPWFLSKIKGIVALEREIRANRLNRDLLGEAKRMGFSDAKISSLKGMTEYEVRTLRKSMGIVPVVKQIDTLAAEWPAATNYLYLTYNGESNDIEFYRKRKIIVLGSGCYRIGSSVEFDWCCVNLGRALKRYADEVIMINCNPETVSTDYDTLDKLYFEEITLERVLDIAEREFPLGVVVSVGGQTPNNLALGLEENGVSIIGPSAKYIDRAEDRSKFSKILDSLGIAQPEWAKLSSLAQAKEFAAKIGYPVLVRPSYVLSGAAMSVAYNEGQLESYLKLAEDVSKDHPTVISKFIEGAREAEVDGVCDGENVFIGSLMEHVENAGTHSGDAVVAIPTLTLDEATRERIKDYTVRIARALAIKGPFNIQYLVNGSGVYVIECNMRASRSMPFVSKVTSVKLMDIAADAIMGRSIKPGEGKPRGVGVKSPQFSFMRLMGADPVSGVEMASTGEVACIGGSFEEALVDALIASGRAPAKAGGTVLLSTQGITPCGRWKGAEGLVPLALKFTESGFEVVAPEKVASVMVRNGVRCGTLQIGAPTADAVAAAITDRKVDLVISIHDPSATVCNINGSEEYLLRRKAVEFGIPLITNLELANALAGAISVLNTKAKVAAEAEIAAK